MYERGYKTSGSPLHFMLRRSSLVECVSGLHRTCLQSVKFFFIRHYVQPCLSKNPKYTFYTIKSSLTLAYETGTAMTVWDTFFSLVSTFWLVASKLYHDVTSALSCNKVGHLFWFTILAQHETNDVILYIHSLHKHRGNSFQRQNYKMRLKQKFELNKFHASKTDPFY